MVAVDRASGAETRYFGIKSYNMLSVDRANGARVVQRKDSRVASLNEGCVTGVVVCFLT